MLPPLPIPRLRPRPQRHRTGGQCRSRRGDGVTARSPAVGVVTGGASGIGRAIATAFAAEGCRVAIADRGAAGPDRRRTRRDRQRAGPAPAMSPTKARCMNLFDCVGRAPRQPRHPGQQRRHPDREAAARDDRRRFRPADRRQPARRVPGRARGAPADGGARPRRPRHQRRLRARLSRPRELLGLLRVQRRRAVADALLGARVRPGHPGQRDRPRADRHADARARQTSPETLAKESQNPLGRIAPAGGDRRRGSVPRRSRRHAS